MFPFLAALSQAGGIIVDKIILTRRRMEIHVFIPVLFLFLFLLTAFLVPFLGEIDLRFFTSYYLLIFLALIISALIWNVFYYQGAQAEKVQEFELIIMFQPLLTILLAALLVEKEVNLHLLIPAFIASITLILTHFRRHHLVFSQSSKGLILAVVFMSLEIIFQKIILEVLSPATLYFVRTGIIFLFFLFYFRPQVAKIAKTNVLLILATSSLGVLQMVTKFYGFQELGIIYTSLVLILSPLLVYFASIFFLHEHLKARTVIFVLIIFACIVYASVLGK